MDEEVIREVLRAVLPDADAMVTECITRHNRIALEYDIPLDMAKCMALSAVCLTTLIVRAKGAGDLDEARKLGAAMCAPYTTMARLLGLPESRVDRALKATVDAHIADLTKLAAALLAKGREACG